MSDQAGPSCSSGPSSSRHTSIATPSGQTSTPLHAAAAGGHLSAVRSLLGWGQPGLLEAVNEAGATALHTAAAGGYHAVVEALLEAGADVAACDLGGRTPLIYAAHAPEAQLAAVKVLLRSGAAVDAADDLGGRALHYACWEGHEEVVRELLLAGASSLQVDNRGCSPLHYAAERGHAELVKLLLCHGAPVAGRNIDGQQPLHYASERGRLRAVEALLACGAPVAAAEGSGHTPLHLACASGHLDVACTLLHAGAPVDACERQGRTPLHLVFGNVKDAETKVALVEVLLAAGLHTMWFYDAVCGMAPLHIAASCGDIVSLRALLTAGADEDIDTEDQLRRTALHHAAAGGHVEAVEELVGWGADINARALANDSALCLHWFMAWAGGPEGAPDSPRRLRRLLHAGADVALASRHFPTPLDILLRLNEKSTGSIPEPSSSAPQLIRTLAKAGCPVATALYCANRSHDALHTPTALHWMVRLSEPEVAWPLPLGASALGVCRELLKGAAAERAGGDPAFLSRAVATGCEELVKVVVETFHQGPRSWVYRGEEFSPLQTAVQRATGALRKLPAPPGGRWQEKHAAPVLNFCRLVELVLEAGCQPSVLKISGHTDLLGPASPPGPAIHMWLPVWAKEQLRHLLPLATAGIGWSPQVHAAFPPGFRQAARTTLLINTCRGFGPAPEQEGVGGGSGPTAGGICGLQLPREQVLAILRLAALPLPVWVPELRPYVRLPDK